MASHDCGANRNVGRSGPRPPGINAWRGQSLRLRFHCREPTSWVRIPSTPHFFHPKIADAQNANRVRRHLTQTLATKPVALLTMNDLRHWRDGLVSKGVAPATINRTRAGLRAALELAASLDDRWEAGPSPGFQPYRPLRR